MAPARAKRARAPERLDDGKRVHLGCFATAEEAAVAYARSEYGRADAAKLLQPRSAPTAASAEAVRQAEREDLTLTASSDSNSGYKGIRYCPKRGSKKYQLEVTSGGKQAEREGLALATSSGSNTGYKGVYFYPKQKGSKKYQLSVWVGGRQVFLGLFATAEEAALARARHLWETTVRLLEPQPQQAPPQGAAGPSEASSYEEEDGFDPADIADAVANSLLSDPPPSASEQRAARRQAAASAAAEEEAFQCVICLDDLSAHPEARLQPRDPNGWGATHCCKSLFHYRCLHIWLNDDSEVETSRGMDPINTACPGCRGFVSKSASRMLQ
ncbi:hypothetical protein EMIHUDRAFT_220174 [Emiliania huxleyi CCMP1516]|uniref:RING-type domain-containing protein n=2 Tax=Emiliania huxleyi TaxID=2903 RepID=A0A0D3I1G5_EMIH1|nr:hypothetical protein EMIHUDRAFT_220174 [Emiliania huxleyi CCMP1516]EOD05100.1 hypothetical protein EMIHUDRAFT_220174 [Emiliania huxleyi CCMP1516]|eukprot:XP_005757529.1 hypothetical protein EMIHUDRAFT_220174 [Emiliania huxleyi CCMP1516]